MNRKVIGLFLLLFLSTTGCHKEEEKLIQEDIIHPFKNTSFLETQNEEYPVMVSHEDGSFITVKMDESGDPEMIFYKVPKNDPMLIWSDEFGNPQKIFYSGTHFFLGNYTSSSVDISIVYPDGSLEVLDDMPIDLSEYFSSDGRIAYSQSENWSLTLAETISWAGRGVSLASCAVSIAAAVATGGVAIPAAVFSCSGALAGVLSDIVPEDWEKIIASADAWSQFVDSFMCGVGDVISCTSAALAVVSIAIEDQEKKEKDNKQTIEDAKKIIKKVPTVQIQEIIKDEGKVKITAKIESEGSSKISELGFFISSEINAKESGEKTTSVNTDNKLFFIELFDLEVNQNYYVAAFAENKNGIGYSVEKDFKLTSSKSIPELITKNPVNITETSAEINAEIVSDGNSEILEIGIYFGTNTDPDISGSKVTNYPIKDNFSVELIDLNPDTKYYVKSYALNSVGRALGNEVEFTTKREITPAEVRTRKVSKVSISSCKLNASIISDGGENIIEKGFFFGLEYNPEETGELYSIVDGDETFSIILSNLEANTTYYFRAFIRNSGGIIYGDISYFNTFPLPPEPIQFNQELNYGNLTDIDGNSYKTIVIGEQEWMVENLRVTHYSDGTPLQLVVDDSTWIDQRYNTKGYYCYYSNDPAQANVYGALYNWPGASNNAAFVVEEMADQIQGVCPAGWHLPSDKEWIELERYLGMSEADAYDVAWRGNVAGKLKENGNTHWNVHHTETSNSTGFTSVPSGYRNGDDALSIGIGTAAYYWASTQESSRDAHFRLISTGDQIWRNAYPIYMTKKLGYSVRCVKD